jgi:acyl-CoA thioester hydrolase
MGNTCDVRGRAISPADFRDFQICRRGTFAGLRRPTVCEMTVVTSTKIRVRYKDTDCMQVVYYGNYLTYFEVGRVEFLRERGMPMSEVNQKVHMPVVDANIRYLRPARLDDLLDVRCWISERKRASFQFSYEILNEAGERVATGSTRHACLDPATGALTGLPPWLQAMMPVGTHEDGGAV